MKKHRFLILISILILCLGYIYFTESYALDRRKISNTELSENNPLNIVPEKVFFLSFKNKTERFSIEKNTKLQREQITDKSSRFNVKNQKILSKFLETIPEVKKQNGLYNSLQPKWVLMDPEGAIVNGELVQKIMDTSVNLQILVVIEPTEQEGGLSVFGLDKPELIVPIGDERERTLEFGDLNLLSGHRYLHLKGDENIYLVDSWLFNDLDIVVGQARSATPFALNIGEITEILSSPIRNHSLQFVREKNGEWFVFGDTGKFLADKNVIEQSLDVMLNFSTQMFLDKGMTSLEMLNLKPADLAITLKVSNKNNEVVILPDILFGQSLAANYNNELELWNPEFGKNKRDYNKVYFAKLDTSPFVYKIASEIYRPFIVGDVNYFKNKMPFSAFDENTIASIKIVSLVENNEKEIFSAEKIKGKFPTIDVKNKVLEIINLLKNFELLTFADLTDEILKQTVHKKITIVEDDGKVSKVLLLEEVNSGQNIVSKEGKKTTKQDTGAPRYVIFNVSDGKDEVGIIGGGSGGIIEKITE